MKFSHFIFVDNDKYIGVESITEPENRVGGRFSRGRGDKIQSNIFFIKIYIKKFKFFRIRGQPTLHALPKSVTVEYIEQTGISIPLSTTIC